MTVKVTRVCETCGGDFLIFPCHLRRRANAGRYCSRGCRPVRSRQPSVFGNAGYRLAFASGYRAASDGFIISPGGMPVNINEHCKSGYLSFSACGVRTPLYVHRFVAYQIFGDVALEAGCVRHRNDDRSNNHFENILFGTRQQNVLDIPQPKRSMMGVKRNRWKRAYTEDQVRRIRQMLAEGRMLTSIQREIGTGSIGALAHIRDGVTYQDVR